MRFLSKIRGGARVRVKEEGNKSCAVLAQRVALFFNFLKFLFALGLHCCTWAFSSCSERGLLFLAVRGLLIVVASLVVEHGL